MSSTGNDIVALKAINVTRTRQTRFYSKIIIDTEKSLYDKALSSFLPLDLFVWQAWSVKESLYKFLQRGQPDLVFSPSHIVVNDLCLPSQPGQYSFSGQTESCNFDRQAYSGRVRSGKSMLFFRSIINDDFIFSVVNDTDDFSSVWWGIKAIGSNDPDDQSTAARLFVQKKLGEIFPQQNIQIRKSEHGYPVVLKNNTEIDLPVSLAHHENFIAYSFFTANENFIHLTP